MAERNVPRTDLPRSDEADDAKRPPPQEATMDGPPPPRQEVDPDTLVERPDAPGQVDGRLAGAPSSGAQQPDAASMHSMDAGHGIEGPSDQRADADQLDAMRDVVGLDELDDLLGGGQGVGGLDGRNDAGDAGHVGSAGEVPDFGASNPIGGGWNGLEGAAGKLPDHQQAVLDQYNQDARDAAAAGDYDAAEEAAAKTEAYLQEIGAKPTESDGGGPKHDMISNFGSGQNGPKQVWDAEKGEVVIVDGDTETNSEGFVTEATQMHETGTAASSEQQDGQPAPPPDEGDVAKDQTPESGATAPDLHRGFTDDYWQHNFEANRGADVDPNPQDDTGASVSGMPDTDPTDLTADYGEGYTPEEPDLEGTELDSGIDEQFMDL